MTDVVVVASTSVVGVVEVDQQVVEVGTGSSVIEVGYTQPGGTLGDKFHSEDFNSMNSITVTHNLGKRPAVTVVDTFGQVCVADVAYISDNICRVDMTFITSGTIYCN